MKYYLMNFVHTILLSLATMFGGGDDAMIEEDPDEEDSDEEDSDEEDSDEEDSNEEDSMDNPNENEDEEEDSNENEDEEEYSGSSWYDWIHENEGEFRNIIASSGVFFIYRGLRIGCNFPPGVWNGEDYVCGHGKKFSACLNYGMCKEVGLGENNGFCVGCIRVFGENKITICESGGFCAVCLTEDVACCKCPQCSHHFCGNCFKNVFLLRTIEKDFCCCPLCKREHHFPDDSYLLEEVN